MSVLAGDIVLCGLVECVVVDVSEDLAVLRSPADIHLLEPFAVPTAQLEVIGHLEGLPGWVEDEPGVWRKV